MDSSTLTLVQRGQQGSRATFTNSSPDQWTQAEVLPSLEHMPCLLQGLAEEQIPTGGQCGSPVQARLQLLPGQAPRGSPGPQGFTSVLLGIQHPQHVLGPQGPRGVEHREKASTEKASI